MTEQFAAMASSARLMRLLWPGALAVQALNAAAKLGVPELLTNGPKSVAELAEITGAHQNSLHRLLSALSSLGVFATDASGKFRHSPASEALCDSHPQSVRRRLMLLTSDLVWLPSSQLEWTVRTGEPAFNRLFGKSFYEYLAEQRELSAIFDSGVESPSASIAALLKAYDFSPFDEVVDVGGGDGSLLAAIMAAHKQVRGVLFDLPGVASDASVTISSELADRLSVVGGNFFDAVPPGADAYLLSHVIHNWSDEAAITILKNCRLAMRTGGRVLIVESVLNSAHDSARLFMDVVMMILTGGRERTEEELRQLLHGAGLTLVGSTRIAGGCLLEASHTAG
jgi:hypothetical protein